MRPFKWRFLIALVLTGLLTLIGMAGPLLMARLLNDVAAQGKWGLFPLLMAGTFAVPLVWLFVNIFNSLTLSKVGLGIIAGIRRDMFRHLMEMSTKFFNEMPAGNIVQRLMGDAAAVSGVATGSLITMITDVIVVVFSVSVMLKMSWQLSVLTFVLFPFYYLNYRFFSRRMERANVVLRGQMDHISSTLQERLSARELVQAFGRGKSEAASFSSQARAIMSASIRGNAYSIAFNQMASLINKLAGTLIYCVGCYYFVKGSMGYGDVIAVCAYSAQLLGPVIRFTSIANQFVQAGVSIDRINEIMGREPDIKDSPDAVHIEKLDGDIALDGVTYAYEDGKPVVRDLRLSVKAGMHLAVVGPHSSGRSTLLTLLRRFVDPDAGAIAVDGRDIRGYRLKDYRIALSSTRSSPTIFDGTIRENVCYSRPDAPVDRMVAVCQAVGLHEFVLSLKNKYETRLGTGGLRLAAGDRQRIGIARSILSDPLVLIIDDATLSLDAESAECVHAAIREAMKGRTYIFIASRLLLARNSDEVVVMNDGQVVEKGKHEDLLVRAGSMYREMYGKQYGERSLPPPGNVTPRSGQAAGQQQPGEKR